MCDTELCCILIAVSKRVQKKEKTRTPQKWTEQCLLSQECLTETDSREEMFNPIPLKRKPPPALKKR